MTTLRARPPRDFASGFIVEYAKGRLQGDFQAEVIPSGVSFLQWLERVARDRTDPSTGKLLRGLKVDGKPFDLSSRPAMAGLYDRMPSTLEEARGTRITLMKCAQVGFTVMEMLYSIYLALKFEPLSFGFFLPDATLARSKSANRFMSIVRSIPEALEQLLKPAPDAARRLRSEGNMTTRWMGDSVLHFLHTSGKTSTESIPMDVISFDEVQQMLIADMEKAQERLSASELKLTLMGSTANWPEADIHYWYLRGTRHRFHTRCPTCGREEPLDEYFPDCIGFDETYPDRVTGLPGEYRYRCREGHWIDDPQVGEWRAENPDAELRKTFSYHFHQMLSPTISPREIMEAWLNNDDRKNFFNRKLGKPYQDPSQIPVTLAHLNKCAAEGMALGLTWKTEARDTCMGVDQMGAYNVVVIKERLADGRQAVVRVEEITSADPFRRCDELMKRYGVEVCVVETLPNYNDAHRFAARWSGKVFLAQYGEGAGDPIRWGDGPKLDASERRTVEEERTRYTVSLNQYKCMSLSLNRFVTADCLFPDPQGLTQEVQDKGVRRRVAILKDRAFVHFQKTALVTERVNEAERKFRQRVEKVGIDPHFSYANMLADVAWSRAVSRASIFLPDSAAVGAAAAPLAATTGLSGLPPGLLEQMAPLPEGEVCGRCIECPDGPSAQFSCKARGLIVNARDLGCAAYVGR